jgi:transketolase
MKNSPSAFVCSRQNLPLLPECVKGEITKGGYLLSEDAGATITLIASGSEVGLALETKAVLNQSGQKVNVVSVPCFDLFIEQGKEYIDSIIAPQSKKIAIEAARGMEWYRLADEVLGMDSFGASAPAEQLFEKFGLTANQIAAKI